MKTIYTIFSIMLISFCIGYSAAPAYAQSDDTETTRPNIYRTPAPIVRRQKSSNITSENLPPAPAATTNPPSSPSSLQDRVAPQISEDYDDYDEEDLVDGDMKKTAKSLQDMNVYDHLKVIAEYCPDNWDKPNCLKANSGATWSMVSSYMAALKQAGKIEAFNTLRDECAAATAAVREPNTPAYAMRSAYTACANTISDLTEKTGIQPDLSYYQLLFIASTCLTKGKEMECQMVEDQIVGYDE